MRYDEIYFLEVDHVEQAHIDAIALGGGDPATRDAGLVHAAVMAPRQPYYGSLAEIAAAYAYGITKNHGFVDGNKRTALSAMVEFLGMQGFVVSPGPEWVRIMEGVASGAVDRDALVREIVRLLGGDVPVNP